MDKLQLGTTQIELVQGDITKVTADALVNAANTGLAGGGGVDGAIHRAGGPDIMKECRAIGHCDTGSAVITGAGNLPARYVIHAVAPWWNFGKSGELEKLRSAYLRSLELAEEKHMESVAFPSLGTGAYCIPIFSASAVAIQTVIEYVQQHPDTSLHRLLFVLYSKTDLMTYQQTLERIAPH